MVYATHVVCMYVRNNGPHYCICIYLRAYIVVCMRVRGSISTYIQLYLSNEFFFCCAMPCHAIQGRAVRVSKYALLDPLPFLDCCTSTYIYRCVGAKYYIPIYMCWHGLACVLYSRACANPSRGSQICHNIYLCLIGSIMQHFIRNVSTRQCDGNDRRLATYVVIMVIDGDRNQ